MAMRDSPPDQLESLRDRSPAAYRERVADVDHEDEAAVRTALPYGWVVGSYAITARGLLRARFSAACASVVVHPASPAFRSAFASAHRVAVEPCGHTPEVVASGREVGAPTAALGVAFLAMDELVGRP